MTTVLLLSQLLPFENAVIDKHAARHWLSTFFFASKVPMWTSGVQLHCWFVKEVPSCVCLAVSTRRPSNNIILRKKWDFTWQNCKHWCLSETYEEYKSQFLPATVSSLTVIVHQTLTSFFSESYRKHIGTFGNWATKLAPYETDSWLFATNGLCQLQVTWHKN